MAEKPLITLETFAANLRETFVQCRELGHLWRPHTATYDRASRVYDRILRCTRCRTERVQEISELGHVLSNRYRYADGYQAKHVEPGAYSRDVFRIESVRRYLTKGT